MDVVVPGLSPRFLQILVLDVQDDTLVFAFFIRNGEFVFPDLCGLIQGPFEDSDILDAWIDILRLLFIILLISK